MALKSLAKSPEKMLEYCGPVDVESRVYYPSFYVDQKQMPEIDEWEVGKEYTLTIKVKMVGYNLDENQEKTRSSANFEMIEYATKAPKSLS